MDEDKKKLVDELLGDKEDNARGELEWVEWQRKKSTPAETLKWLAREHEEQKLDVITSWREAGEAVALAARLVNRAKATMGRQGWWLRFEKYRCGEDERGNKLFQACKGLTLAKKGIEGVVKALRAVEFPNTFADIDEIGGSTLPLKKREV